MEPLPGFNASSTTGINDLGEVVGESSIQNQYPDRPVATVWRDGRPAGFAAGLSPSTAAAINRHGQVVGTLLSPPRSTSRTFRVLSRGRPPALLPGRNSWGTAINDVGTIVGHVRDMFRTRAYVHQDGRMTLLDVPGDYVASKGLNNAGVVVGVSVWDGGHNGWIFDHDVLTELPISTDAVAINSSGVVLVSRWGRENTDASLYINGRLETLPSPAGADECQAMALNDRNVAVGICHRMDGSPVVVRWSDGDVVDLSNLISDGSGDGWFLTAVSGINGAGQIAGWGWITDPQGEYVRRAFLLSPVP
ncbi:hypothetical protein AACH06_19445 [Ideonella sp. DXS29W]|uniref:HAF repeat-containing protein n=1 Tax=Ideonella lacteola TaxID=2984193 RepID=A0ABU9BU59_9BURK